MWACVSSNGEIRTNAVPRTRQTRLRRKLLSSTSPFANADPSSSSSSPVACRNPCIRPVSVLRWIRVINKQRPWVFFGTVFYSPRCWIKKQHPRDQRRVVIRTRRFQRSKGEIFFFYLCFFIVQKKNWCTKYDREIFKTIFIRYDSIRLLYFFCPPPPIYFDQFRYLFV